MTQLQVIATGIDMPPVRKAALKAWTDAAAGRHLFARLRQRFARTTYALPLDIFRVAVGILAFAYFLQIFLETVDFSSPDGLVDHAFSLRVLWFTRLGLFPSGIGTGTLLAIFLTASVCSWALILGYRVKLFATFLYVVAVPLDIDVRA
jgi:hypothetical protein